MPTSIAVAAVILLVALYSTHGWHRKTHAAALGTLLTVVMTGVLSWVGVAAAQLSGLATDEAVFLSGLPGTNFDFRGLLLAGMIIGILGILDDIAITQASVVAELRSAAPHLRRFAVYRKALRVGREHVGALVNTLALAYAGSALPLLLLFVSAHASPTVVLNGELIATEIIRTTVGSIGLIMAVPITTALAVLLLHPEDADQDAHIHAHGH